MIMRLVGSTSMRRPSGANKQKKLVLHKHGELTVFIISVCCLYLSWGGILGKNPDKGFPPCYSQSPLQLCIEIFISSNSRNLLLFLLLYTVKEKGGKPDRRPYPLTFGLRNPYRNLKSENSQDYAKKPQQNCTFMNLASALAEGFLSHPCPGSFQCWSVSNLAH